MRAVRQGVLIICGLLLGGWCVPASATVTYVGAGALGAATLTTDATAALPAGTQADDILFVYCWSRDTGDTTTVTDYTEVAQVDTSTGSHRLFWKRHDGSEGTATCNHDTSSDNYAIQRAFRGVVTSGNPWNAIGSFETAGAEPVSLTGITTGAIGSMVVMFGGYEDNDTASFIQTGTDPAGYTEVYAESTTGADGSMEVGYAIRTAAGSTGTVSVDFNASLSDQFAGILLSLQDACSGLSFGNGFTCIQFANNADTDSGTALTATMSANATAGNQVIVTAFACADINCVNSMSTPTVTLTDGNGDTVSLPTTPCGNVQADRKLCVGIFANVGATATFTATWSTTVWYLQVEAVEWSGGATSNPFDVDASHCGAASGASLTCSLTTSSTALIFGRINHETNVATTPGSGFTEVHDTGTTMQLQAKSAAAGANDCTWSWTGSSKNGGICVAMKQAEAGGDTATPPQQMLTGVGD